MKYSQEYSTDNICNIPGPVIELTIYNSSEENLITKDIFLIDSGADITVIREQIFDVLDLDICGEVSLLGIGNSEDEESSYQTCFVDIEIPQMNFKQRTEVAINRINNDNLLGRDFLSNLKVFLDGPEQKFSIIA